MKPYRLERSGASNDPDFETKAADIIGLYLTVSLESVKKAGVAGFGVLMRGGSGLLAWNGKIPVLPNRVVTTLRKAGGSILSMATSEKAIMEILDERIVQERRERIQSDRESPDNGREQVLKCRQRHRWVGD